MFKNIIVLAALLAATLNSAFGQSHPDLTPVPPAETATKVAAAKAEKQVKVAELRRVIITRGIRDSRVGRIQADIRGINSRIADLEGRMGKVEGRVTELENQGPFGGDANQALVQKWNDDRGITTKGYVDRKVGALAKKVEEVDRRAEAGALAAGTMPHVAAPAPSKPDVSVESVKPGTAPGPESPMPATPPSAVVPPAAAPPVPPAPPAAAGTAAPAMGAGVAGATAMMPGATGAPVGAPAMSPPPAMPPVAPPPAPSAAPGWMAGLATIPTVAWIALAVLAFAVVVVALYLRSDSGAPALYRRVARAQDRRKDPVKGVRQTWKISWGPWGNTGSLEEVRVGK